MGRKRRQRSTSIRKRIEKKQREDDKQRRKLAKRAGIDQDILLKMTVDRPLALACAAEISALGVRLAAGPIRGWTPSDLEGEDGNGGLSWFGTLLQEAADSDESAELECQVPLNAQQPVLDRLSALEMAAPGLDVDWEVGFARVARSLSHAEEPPPPEEDEEEDA